MSNGLYPNWVEVDEENNLYNSVYPNWIYGLGGLVEEAVDAIRAGVKVLRNTYGSLTYEAKLGAQPYQTFLGVRTLLSSGSVGILRGVATVTRTTTAAVKTVVSTLGTRIKRPGVSVDDEGPDV